MTLWGLPTTSYYLLLYINPISHSLKPFLFIYIMYKALCKALGFFQYMISNAVRPGLGSV